MKSLLFVVLLVVGGNVLADEQYISVATRERMESMGQFDEQYIAVSSVVSVALADGVTELYLDN